MKKLSNLLICFSYILFLGACSDDDDKTTIQSTEFILPEGCRWKPDFAIGNQEINKLQRIDNLNELSLFTDCENENIFDFENKTLLFVLTNMNNGRPVEKITHRLYLTDDNNPLRFDVFLHLYKGPEEIEYIYRVYYVAVSVDKIDKSVPIELSIIKK